MDRKQFRFRWNGLKVRNITENKKMKTRIVGELEIDHQTGKIYFHTMEGRCLLRIQGLPAPIPEKTASNFFDVRYEEGSVNWTPIKMEEAEEISISSQTKIG